MDERQGAVEALVTGPDPSVWQGRRVFMTGHTGFKGGWMSLWLAKLGATVRGYALDPARADALWRESMKLVGERF